MTPQSTPKRRERILENADRKATAARFLRALARHIGDGDVDDLALLAELEAEVERARAQAVAGLRAQGYSWEDVARGLGCSRQYAWRTYAGTSPVTADRIGYALRPMDEPRQLDPEAERLVARAAELEAERVDALGADEVRRAVGG